MNKKRKKAIYILAIAAGVSAIAFAAGVFINKKIKRHLIRDEFLRQQLSRYRSEYYDILEEYQYLADSSAQRDEWLKFLLDSAGLTEEDIRVMVDLQHGI